eukprot:gnl/TRDRNA2_/TRDRNA2_80590_c0_seq1.p1 gnl/TRDRNA2_/TRDRNA2_80590_c0~~gnl/TRDRNA2_/TRDRNA2_80590_c0_seq1.p1  ORF type:complete len:311 (-),score=43.03 gnl/TRDRNA2_/TRDRNA2_80590_c0_seq1:112-1044(-)
MAEMLITEQRHGLWGPPFTAGQDFCERNYEYTEYICEAWNTASALAIVYAGLAGLVQARLQSLPLACSIVALMVAVIGVGSAVFHGTLTRGGQVLDELVMVWASLSAHWALLRVSGELSGRCLVSGHRDEATISNGNSADGAGTPRANLGTSLSFIDLLFGSLVAVGTAVYFVLDFAYFIALYVVCIFWLATSVYRLALKPATERASESSGSEVAGLAQQCVIIYCSGFIFLWVPTEIFCNSLRQWFTVDWFRYTHALFHLTSSWGPIAFFELLAWQHHSRHGIRVTLQRRSVALLGMDAVVRAEKCRQD